MLPWSRPSTVTPEMVTSALLVTVMTAYLVGRLELASVALTTRIAASGDSMMVWPVPAPWMVMVLAVDQSPARDRSPPRSRWCRRAAAASIASWM